MTLPINNTSLWLYRVQDGRCVICRGVLSAVEDRPQPPKQWETWLATTRKTIDIVWDPSTPDKADHPVSSTSTATPPAQPTGLA